MTPAQIEEQIEESIALSIPPHTIARLAYEIGCEEEFKKGQERMIRRACMALLPLGYLPDSAEVDLICALPIEEAP